MYIASGKTNPRQTSRYCSKNQSMFSSYYNYTRKLNKNQFKQLKIILINKKFQHTSWLQPYKDPPASASSVEIKCMNTQTRKNVYKS